MATIDIPAHIDGATVEVYEPKQHPEQDEVLLDRFELLPGETRKDYELRSATAGIRYRPLGEETLRRWRDEQESRPPVSAGAGGIENKYGIVPTEEMDAGRERQQELEKMERDREKAQSRSEERRLAAANRSTSARAKDEQSTGAEAQKQYAEGVGTKGEAPRGSNEPHAGSPNELGQPVGSPAAHITGYGATAPGPERTADVMAAVSPAGVGNPTVRAADEENRRRESKSVENQRQPRKKEAKPRKSKAK